MVPSASENWFVRFFLVFFLFVCVCVCVCVFLCVFFGEQRDKAMGPAAGTLKPLAKSQGFLGRAEACARRDRVASLKVRRKP